MLGVIDPLASAVSTRVMALLAIGGALDTIGVVFHLWRRLPYQNAIWHVFVMRLFTMPRSWKRWRRASAMPDRGARIDLENEVRGLLKVFGIKLGAQ